MQGFNMGRYVPPDQEGVMSGNQIHGKHALGARANKLSQGILTVRFEMPYPIWCTTCPKPTIIGQGVRFNAEKKKVGKYYSTPIFSFRMKHVACGGWIEIRTDPQNTAYVVTEGARKRDTGEDKVLDGDMKIMTQDEREAMRDNAFASLEGKVEDKQRLEHSKKRLAELEDLSEKQWEDPYDQNKKLRKFFREGRHLREKDAAVTTALQDRMSLSLELLPAIKDDSRRAKAVEFGEWNQNEVISKTISKPLFQSKSSNGSKKADTSRKTKKKMAEDLANEKAASVIADIRGNTRAALDPFLISTSKQPQKKLLIGVKRKRGPEDAPLEQTSSLVDYDSD